MPICRLLTRCVILPLVIVAALAGSGCTRKDAESKETGPAEAVLVSPSEVVRVESRTLEAGVSFTGELQPAQIVEVNARFDGDLDRVLVREGQAVRRGQALAVYRPRDVEDRMRAAEAHWLAAQAAMRAAENGEKRARRLYEAGAASSSDLEAAEAGRTAAQAALDQAEAVRNTSREDVERLDVPSPIRGSVSRVHVHGGDRTAVGDPLFQVVDTDTMELSATVPSETLSRVRPGTPIRFRVDSYPDETFEGKVNRINPTTEPGTRQIRVYSRFPNPGGKLVGGLFASGRVIEETRADVTAASVRALRNEGTEQVVYRLRGGRAEKVRINIGIVDEDAGICELIGPLEPGDSLLTGVLPGLRDGVAIRVLAGSATGVDEQRR